MAAMEASLVPHIAIFSSPGFGHVAPATELGRLLVSLHGLRATVFAVTTGPASAQSPRPSPAAVPDGLRLIELLPTDVSSAVPTNAHVGARVSATMRASLPALRSALLEEASSGAPSVLVVDIFGTDAFDVADELGMSKYVFFTSTAAFLALMLYAPALDRDAEGGYPGFPGPVCVPGCRTIRFEDLTESLRLKRTDGGYRRFLDHCRRLPMAQGILVNTCKEMEPEPLTAMRCEPAFTEVPTPPVYPVGPVIHSGADNKALKQDHLQWLESQPPGSVLFVSFGGGGTLCAEQMAELAWGLESSNQRFLWVCRRPSQGNSASTYFNPLEGGSGAVNGSAFYLPGGFLDRTEGRGLLVQSWAPQAAILGHPSVGGFLTHGGWNSALESLAHGVAMAVWPLYAEQRMNAAKLEEELGVAVRVRRADGAAGRPGMVGREEVERVARLLMEGDEGRAMKARAAELRDGFAMALSEGGSSRRGLADVVGEWKLGR
ncbi:hypothetical protein Taro_002501 [Colocasia esculenta]|uniref:Glycosyltransferase n=1 Tax=Colocasia esculenta TaxID=4460 RepID=A0A843THE0_COLES|nr:hypothetical protein [Colocasia esculenta]